MTNKYYQENKEKLQKEVCKKYKNLSEEEKKKTFQHHRERNKILSEEQKKRQVEYGRNYYITHNK